MRRWIAMLVVVFAMGTAAPAAALLGGDTTTETGSRWGCAGVEPLVGLCLDNPLPSGGLVDLP